MVRMGEVRLRRLVCGASMLALGLALANQASAQSATAPGEVEEVVVTGFRASLASAIEAKKAETAIVDSIKAEDIADFPDLNLAESIQRIPGVSIDRDAGEGRSLTVRGLSADFTRTRINGMEAQATTGGTDSSGGANRGRGFDFNVFASELFNSITIRKTAAAETEEGSLGATIDLRTTRPFDYKGFTSAVSAQYGYNDLSKNWDPRVAAMISDTFLDGRLGVLASVAYSERNLYEEGFSSVRWERGNDNNGFCSPQGVTPLNPASGNGASATMCATGVARPANSAALVSAFNTVNSANVFHPRLPRYGRLVHEQERLGFTGAVQFKATDATTISLDVLYSKLDATRQENFLESLSLSRNAAAGGKPQISVTEAFVNAAGELAYGVFNNVDVRSEQRFDELSTEFIQTTLTLEHKFSDSLRVKGFVGRAISDFENPVQTTVTLDRQNVQGYSYDFRGNPNAPAIGYGFNVADAASWQWRDASLGAVLTALPRSEIRMRPNFARTEFNAAQADIAWDFNDDITFKAGVNWKTYESRTFEARRADETVVPALPAGTTVANISTLLTGYGKGLGQPSGNATSWVAPDLDAIASLFNIYCNCNTGVAGGDFRLTSFTNGNARAGNRYIKEEDLAFYGQVDFRFDVGEMVLRGNAGVRQAYTDLYAEGFSSTGGGTLVFGENEYSDTLPSLNLSLAVTDEIYVRFGAAKVIARPQIGNTLAGTNYLVPTTSLSATGPNFTASIGNVDLKPFRANTFDLSFEWYFQPEALLSVALFYKDIDSFIQIVRQDLPYSELTAFNESAFAPGFCLAQNACSPSTVFQLSRALNTEGGPLKGFEVSYQQPFSFLPAPFDNFGVLLNFTRVKSDIDYCNNALCTAFVTDDLINLSPKAYNATLYYEDSKLSARVSAAYRQGYLQNVPGRNGNFIEGKKKTLNVDAAGSYKIRENITLTVEALNLTDEDNHQFVGSDDRQSTSVYHHTGRQFYIGARYTF